MALGPWRAEGPICAALHRDGCTCALSGKPGRATLRGSWSLFTACFVAWPWSGTPGIPPTSAPSGSCRDGGWVMDLQADALD